jgi:hypothetical protein
MADSATKTKAKDVITAQEISGMDYEIVAAVKQFRDALGAIKAEAASGADAAELLALQSKALVVACVAIGQASAGEETTDHAGILIRTTVAHGPTEFLAAPETEATIERFRDVIAIHGKLAAAKAASTDAAEKRAISDQQLATVLGLFRPMIGDPLHEAVIRGIEPNETDHEIKLQIVGRFIGQLAPLAKPDVRGVLAEAEVDTVRMFDGKSGLLLRPVESRGGKGYDAVQQVVMRRLILKVLIDCAEHSIHEREYIEQHLSGLGYRRFRDWKDHALVPDQNMAMQIGEARHNRNPLTAEQEAFLQELGPHSPKELLGFILRK